MYRFASALFLLFAAASVVTRSNAFYLKQDDRVVFYGGPIDERLERDVIARRPTVVTLMFGMNDRVSDKTRGAYRGCRDVSLPGRRSPGVRLCPCTEWMP